MLTQIVIVAQPSPELELALDALDDLRHNMRLFSRLSEAATALLAPSGSARARPIAVVLIEVGNPGTGVADLVAELRREPATAGIPIVLWGLEEALRGLELANGSRPNSYVRTASDPTATTTALTQTLHYWAVVNRPPDSPPISQNTGGRA
ncbi:MAG: hypothetical protein IID07_03905 [Gemmatimonadetes bacterium]|nr:hypothetical protein [Gemmatimonadota bacterium]